MKMNLPLPPSAADLPIPYFYVNFNVMMSAETHQITAVMRPALRHRHNVMDFLNWSEPSFLQAHLAEGVLRSIAVADSLPVTSVFLMDVRGASVLVVLALHQLPVFLAVLAVR